MRENKKNSTEVEGTSLQERKKLLPERLLEIHLRHEALECVRHIIAAWHLELNNDALVPFLELPDTRMDLAFGTVAVWHCRTIHLLR